MGKKRVSDLKEGTQTIYEQRNGDSCTSNSGLVIVHFLGQMRILHPTSVYGSSTWFFILYKLFLNLEVHKSHDLTTPQR